MNALTIISRIVIPRESFARGYEFLRDAGKLGYEGLMLLVGRGNGDTFQVSDVWIPKQKGLRTADGICVVVEAEEMHQINVALYKSELELVGQIHTHPTDAYHSETDDEFAIATVVGAVSIVVPNFAERPFHVEECAVYRLQSDGEWQALKAAESAQLIVIRD